MKKPVRLLTLLVSAFSLLILVGSTHAATITYGPTSFGAFAAGASGGFNVPQFDPSFGTLVQVDLYVAGHSDGGSNSVENLTANLGTGTASIGTDISVSGPAALVVLTTPATTGSGPMGPYDGTALEGGTDTFTVNGAPSSDSDSASLTSSLSPYIGLGNVTFSYSSVVNTANSANVSPTVSYTTPPTFDFDATVVYTYVVPEPASIGIFSTAIVAGLSRRRRK